MCKQHKSYRVINEQFNLLKSLLMYIFNPELNADLSYKVKSF